MTEQPALYDAGKVEDYYWVECKVRLPGPRSETSGEFQEFMCLAKIQCADVVDALNLDRWTTQAFQYIWRSGRKHGEPQTKELAKAAWFLQRGFTREGHWQARLCDVVAKVIENVIQTPCGSVALKVALAGFAAGLRTREASAVEIVAEGYGDELVKAPKYEGKVGL